MIYTVTANPSIDYILRLDAIDLGNVNRCNYDAKLPGGKGINVSRILQELGYDSCALGFLGGFTGQFVEKALKNSGLHERFTRIQDDTRINVKIKAEEETELNAVGPHISEEEIEAFSKQFDKLNAGDIVVFAGSLPACLPETFYFDLIQKVRQQDAEFVIDTTGEKLLQTLEFNPLVVKPNNHELAELFATTFNDMDDIVSAAKKLLEKGAQHVLVSMAGDGGLLVTHDGVWRSFAPTGTVINSVGAGDSMIAGFTGTFAHTHDALEAFRYGLACGSATAFSEDLASRAKIDEILPKIQIEKY